MDINILIYKNCDKSFRNQIPSKQKQYKQLQKAINNETFCDTGFQDPYVPYVQQEDEEIYNQKQFENLFGIRLQLEPQQNNIYNDINKQSNQIIYDILNPDTTFSTVIQRYDKWYKDNKNVMELNPQFGKKYILDEQYNRLQKEINNQAKQLQLGYQWYPKVEEIYKEKQIEVLQIICDLIYIYQRQSDMTKQSLYPIHENQVLQEKCITYLNELSNDELKEIDFKPINDEIFKFYHSGHYISQYTNGKKNYLLIEQAIITCTPNVTQVNNYKRLRLYTKLDCSLLQQQTDEYNSISKWFKNYDGIVMIISNQDQLMDIAFKKMMQRTQLSGWKITVKDNFDEVAIVVLEHFDKQIYG